MRVRFTAVLGATLAVMASATIADDWGRYDNPRFAYAIDIPPGFLAVAEADNGDGGVSRSRDGRSEMRVWGAYLSSGDFPSEIADRVRSDANAGWMITYDFRREAAASWSGSLGGRVFYARATKGCDDAAIYFRIEYDTVELEAYHQIIDRLVETLRPTC